MENIFSYLQLGVSSVIPFIILLGLLIFVHELGHFLVAKFFGVRVEVFSLGFGKKILQYKKGETNYCISLIPLGGYVKMFGDEIGAQLPESEKKYSFSHKPVSQRIAVVLAGPLMNFFFAILILFIVAMIGEEARAPKMGDIDGSSPAYQLGFRSGDKILKVNESKIQSWEQFQNQISDLHDQNVQIQVEREGSDQVQTITAVPTLEPNPNILSMREMIGAIDGVKSQSYATMIGVVPQSVAINMGFQTGDEILSINDIPVKYFREIENKLVAVQGQEIKIKVRRYDSYKAEKSSDIVIDVKSSKIISSLDSLGIESSQLYLAHVFPKSPAETAGLKAGDKILQVNEVIPQRWEDVLNSIKNAEAGKIVKLSVQRNQEKLNFEITPQVTSHLNAQGAEEKRQTIGIIPWVSLSEVEVVSIKYSNPVDALVRGFNRTVEISGMTVVSFLRLIQNKISPKTIGGVISIGAAAKESFKLGAVAFLQMMALISVNLFILNLLPIPVLDGGHLLFYTIEAIKGAPVSMRKMEIAQQIGLALLMSLMVFALFNDFSRILF